MDYLGLFCLGVFAGTIATFGMTHVTTLEGWKTVLALSLPAVLGGGVMVMVDRFDGSPALGCFPMGLVASLVWAFAPDSVKLIRSPDEPAKIIGWAHLGIAFCVTAGLAILAALPAVKQVCAELQIPPEVRWTLLVRQQLDTARPPNP